MNIHYFRLAADGSNIELSDNGLKLSLYENYKYLELARCIEKLRKEGDFIVFHDRLETVTVAARLYSLEPSNPVLVIGPFFTAPVTPEYYARIFKYGVVNEAQLPFLKSAIDCIPVLYPSSNSISVITAMLAYISERKYTQVAETEEISEHHKSITGKVQLQENSRIVEESYSKENAMLAAVAAGDTELALLRFEELAGSNVIRNRLKDQVQNLKNYAIILNTLLRKTVESTGVHPVYLDYISSIYANEINNTRTIAYCALLARRMIRGYSFVVKKKSLPGFAPVIREVILYTDQHLAEKLSLSFFSEKYNISPAYLSALFKKEMGVTLTAYIRKVRLKRVDNLTRTTALPLSVIAQKTGYESASYLIRHFKAEYGCAPRQYQLSSENNQ